MTHCLGNNGADKRGWPRLSRATSAAALWALPVPSAPRAAARARDRRAGTAPAHRTRTRGRAGARAAAGLGVRGGMRVRRGGERKEGRRVRAFPCARRAPGGAAGALPQPRSPPSFGAAGRAGARLRLPRSFMSAGSRAARNARPERRPRGLAPARGREPQPARGPRPAPPQIPGTPRHYTAGRPRLPPLGLLSGAFSSSAASPQPPRRPPSSPAPARPRRPAPRRRLCPCERPAAASLPPHRSPNFSRAPAARTYLLPPVRSGDQDRAGGGGRAAGWVGGDEPSAPPPLEGTCGFPSGRHFFAYRATAPRSRLRLRIPPRRAPPRP